MGGQGPGSPGNGVCPLVAELDPRVSGCRAPGVSALVLAHWCVEPHSGSSGGLRLGGGGALWGLGGGQLKRSYRLVCVAVSSRFPQLVAWPEAFQYSCLQAG